MFGALITSALTYGTQINKIKSCGKYRNEVDLIIARTVMAAVPAQNVGAITRCRNPVSGWEYVPRKYQESVDKVYNEQHLLAYCLSVRRQSLNPALLACLRA